MGAKQKGSQSRSNWRNAQFWAQSISEPSGTWQPSKREGVESPQFHFAALIQSFFRKGDFLFYNLTYPLTSNSKRSRHPSACDHLNEPRLASRGSRLFLCQAMALLVRVPPLSSLFLVDVERGAKKILFGS